MFNFKNILFMLFKNKKYTKYKKKMEGYLHPESITVNILAN